MATKAAQHTTPKRYNPKSRSRAQEIRATQAWKDLSEHKRRINPLCEDPFGIHQKEGITTPCAHAHHIQSVESRPDLAFVMTNLMSVCTKCHSMLEQKAKEKESEHPCEYLCIFGAPASGKSTYVEQHKKPGDMIVDVDALYRALGCDTRDHPKSMMPFVLDARDAILSRLKQPHDLKRVWVITTTKRVADWCSFSLRARLVTMTATQEECIARVNASAERQCVSNLHSKLIQDWFRENRLP